MEKLVVIKIGGNIVDSEEALKNFLLDFSQIPHRKVLVHGGGKIASRIGQSLGIEPNMVEGRRVTDKETLDVVTMVYAGLINKNIVAQLQSLNCNAMGFSGADGNVIQSHKRTGSKVDYGFVGDVDAVDGSFLSIMIDNDRTPVMAPITHDKKGQLLNTNADTIASEVAKALSNQYQVELTYCFELPGVMRDIKDKNSVITEINEVTYAKLKEEGIVADGMIPKLDNCFEAINAGVSSVRIAQASDLKSIYKNESQLGTVLIK